ncbi:calponin homology domain-containing protein DDB_G0272472-like [Camellia sinensis]|uniref:calponin homology domain-containing protein DDB_G0272472-like n=1 Tax=Camellia sinensis TaxID=4442 RepID=UPI001036B8D1|nr:calponin homology domain-containing protein DDB_G0272472-like [Camellia sinensis]
MVEEAREKGVEATPKRVGVPDVQGDKGQGVQEEEEHLSAVPKVLVESGLAGPEEGVEQQSKGGPAFQGEGDRLTTAIYHACKVFGRLEGEEGPARAAADRLVGVVDEAAVEAAKVKLEEAKAQLASFKKESAGWKKAVRSACARGWEEAGKAKKMGMLVVVQKNVADRAHFELRAVKLELEDKHRRVVSLEFQLAGERKKVEETQKACTIANERWDEAMVSNEKLRAQSIKEKEELDRKIVELERDLADEGAKATTEKATLEQELADERAKAVAEKVRLEKELEEEKTKAAFEKAAYPDLCVAAVEQFKGSPNFQIAIDAVIASNLARERLVRRG